MSLANFKISEGLNIKGIVLDNNSGMLTWDGDNIATEGYVTTAIGNISIPPAYITSVGSNLSVTDGELNVDFTGLATETYVGNQGFLVSADLSGYALTADLDGVITGYNYITASGQYIQSVDSNFTVTSNELTLNGTISVSEIDVAGSGDFTVTGNANIVLNPASGSKAYIGSVSSNNEIVTIGNVPAGYTNTDVDNHLSGGNGITYSSGTISVNIGSSEYLTLSGGTLDVDTNTIATQSYVGNQGFLVSSDLSGYATETYVGNQGFLTSADLSGYATETYVGNQGFITTSGQYIQSVGSNLSVTSNELNVDLTSKQDALTAGTYITITGSTIDVDTDTIATKAYVDATAQGLDVKASVLRASSTNVDLTGNVESFTFDGATALSTKRYLLRGQTNTGENGIYTYDEVTGDFTRTADATFNSADDTLTKGSFVFVESGTDAGKGFVASNIQTGLVGANVTFTQFSAAGSYVGGDNITITGNSIAVSDAPTFNNPTITVGSGSSSTFSQVILSTAYSSQAYIEVDGSSPLASATSGNTISFPDVPSLSAYSYVYDSKMSINGGATYYIAIANTFASGAEAPLLAWISANSGGTTTNITLTSGSTTTVSSTEISYLDGVTSNIQTQLNAKQDTLASTTDVSVKTVTTQNADGVSSKVVAFGNTTDTTYAYGSDVTVGTLGTGTVAADIFLQIINMAGDSRTSKLTAIFNGGSAPIWTEYGVVDSGTLMNATVSFDSSKNIIVNVSGLAGTYAVRGTATSLL